MNEGRTTVIFGVVAVVTLGMAWWAKPEAVTSEADALEGRVGEDVILGFDDPDKAASLQIIKYDEELAQLKRFEVARDKEAQLWKLPSHDGYPADAAEQVRDAITPLIGLKVLSVESGLPSDHELYGVVNPDDEELAAGTSGVGMLIRLKDDSSKVLASLIVGKEVEQVEGQRYVRIPTEDAVYKVELDTNAFTTNFRDWIEGELLGVRSFDITSVAVRDYELQQQSLTSIALKRNFDADVSYDNSGSQWQLESMHVYEGLTPVPEELAEGEELNTEFLNTLRTSIQELEIVDVKRKPKGLAADLKADESLLEDQESVSSLQRQGFYPAGGPDGTEIFAAGGETIIGTNDGVNYVLRFGEATASLSSVSEDEEAGGLSRYLLVTARLDDSQFPAPELEPLPETVEEMLARERGDAEVPGDVTNLPPLEDADSGAAEESGDAATEPKEKTANPTEDASGSTAAETPEAGTGPETSEGTSEEPQAEESKTDEPNSEAPKAEPASGSEPDDQPDADPEEPQEGDSSTADGDATSQETPDSASAATETNAGAESGAQAGAPGAETPAKAPAQGGDTTTDGGEQAAQETGSEKPEETEEELQERLEAVREQIAKDNQRKIDERNEKLDEARKRVQELNARFSEWYYVVSDSVYKKLKITREDLVQSSEGDAAEGNGLTDGLVPGLPNGLSLPPQP